MKHGLIQLILTTWFVCAATGARAESVLILDDTPAAADAAAAAELAGLEAVATRNVAGFVLEYARQPRWDLLVIDLNRLVFAGGLLEPVRDHVEAGRPIIISAPGLANFADAMALLGLDCVPDLVGNNLVEADGSELFLFEQSVPTTVSGARRSAQGSSCAAGPGDEVLAWYQATVDPGVLLHDEHVLWHGVGFDQYRDVFDDADTDGVRDAVELLANEMSLLLDRQRPTVYVIGRNDLPAPLFADTSKVELALATSPADVVLARAAGEEVVAVYLEIATTDVDEAAWIDDLDALASAGVELLVFSPVLSELPELAAWLDVEAADASGDSPLIPGEPGLESLVFTQPLVVPELEVAQAGGADSRDVIVGGTLQVLGWFDDGAALVGALDGGLVVGAFLPSRLEDSDGAPADAELLTNCLDFARRVGPLALVWTDSPAAVFAQSSLNAALQAQGLFPIVTRDPDEFAQIAENQEVALVAVELDDPQTTATPAALNVLEERADGERATLIGGGAIHDVEGLLAAFGVVSVRRLAPRFAFESVPAHLAGVFEAPAAVDTSIDSPILTVAAPLTRFTQIPRGAAIAVDQSDGLPIIASAHNMAFIVNGVPASALAGVDSDRDRVDDFEALLGNEIAALLSPRRALVVDFDLAPLAVAAVGLTGLQAVQAPSPEAFATLAAGEWQHAVVRGDAESPLAIPEVAEWLIARAAAGAPFAIADAGFDQAPGLLDALGLQVSSVPADELQLVEPFDEPNRIFRRPFVVPNPIDVTTAPVEAPDVSFVNLEDNRVVARYNSNFGPAAGVVGADGTWIVLGFDPVRLGNEDLNSDDVPDAVALLANALVRTGATPFATIAGPVAVDEGRTVTLDASGSSDPSGGVLEWSWDLDGDGTFGDATGPQVQLDATLIDGPELVPVAVRVTNEAGLAVTAEALVEVRNAPPVIIAEPPRIVAQGEAFVALAGVSDVPGDTFEVVWDFGDSTSANGLEVSHTWDEVGRFTVQISATDEDGGVGTTSFVVEHRNTLPDLSVEAPAELNEGESGEFVATVTDELGDSWAAEWRFGDESVEGATVSYGWREDGQQSALCVVTDEWGDEVTAEVYVEVYNLAPTITSPPPTSVRLGASLVYQAIATDPGLDDLTWSLVSGPDTMAVSADGLVTWSAGPGTTARVAVELRVDDGDGGEATQSFVLDVEFDDSDGGGAPDDCEETYGNDRDDADDDLRDDDGDGLTFADECLSGSDPLGWSGPSVPTPLAPVDGERVLDSTVVLVFSQAGDPEGDPIEYELDLSTSPTFDSTFASLRGVERYAGGVMRVELRGPLEEDTPLYWRVRALTEDVAGEWSEPASFVADRSRATATAPQLLSPVGVAESNAPIVCVAGPIPAGVVVELEVTDGAARVWEASVAAEGAEAPVCDTVTPALTPGSWFVRARARSATLPAVASQYSVAAFEVLPPSVDEGGPALVAPVGAVLPADRDVELLWRALEGIPATEVTWEIELDDDEAFGSPVVVERGLTAVADPVRFAIVGGPGLGTWHWRVRALTAAGATPWSTARFEVAPPNRPPSAPDPSLPQPGADIDETSQPVIFSFGAADDPDTFQYLTYSVQVASDFEMREILFTIDPIPGTGTSVSASVPGYLAPGTYYWRVRAWDGVIGGTWSSVSSFDIVRRGVAEDVADDTSVSEDSSTESGGSGGEDDSGGCAAAGGGRPASLLPLGLAALLVLRRRCRSRRFPMA